VPSLPQVLAKIDLPEIAPLARGEKSMLERKKPEGFCRELQTPSREDHTPNAHVQQSEEDAKSQLTQS
jgi:hypothetical protein